MPDEIRRRRVPIAERGPGWTYRPQTDLGEHQPGVSTAHLKYALLAAYDGALPRFEPPPQTTVTIGFGATAFGDRTRPTGLRPLPPFNGDALDPALCGGDFCLLICSDERPPDPPPGTPRWMQRGIRGDRGALGFREGTLNLRRPRDFDRHVWVTRNDRSAMLAAPTWWSGASRSSAAGTPSPSTSRSRSSAATSAAAPH